MVAGPLLDGIPTVYDGSSASFPALGVGAGSVAAAERWVDELAAAEVDLIIAEGMLADLILLNANPLENIGNTRRIHAVVRDGKLHDRKALDQMLKALENK